MSMIFFSYRAPDGMQIFEKMSGEATFDATFFTNEALVKNLITSKRGKLNDLIIYEDATKFQQAQGF